MYSTNRKKCGWKLLLNHFNSLKERAKSIHSLAHSFLRNVWESINSSKWLHKQKKAEMMPTDLYNLLRLINNQMEGFIWSYSLCARGEKTAHILISHISFLHNEFRNIPSFRNGERLSESAEHVSYFSHLWEN